LLFSPAQEFDEVDQLVFKNTQECLEPAVALEATNGRLTIAPAESIEKYDAADCDLVKDLAVFRSEALCGCTCASQPLRKSEVERTVVQRLAAESAKESFIVSLEQEFQIPRVHRGVVRLPDIFRVSKKVLLDFVDTAADSGGIERVQLGMKEFPEPDGRSFCGFCHGKSRRDFTSP
jgi:hypothetical protein